VSSRQKHSFLTASLHRKAVYARIYLRTQLFSSIKIAAIYAKWLISLYLEKISMQSNELISKDWMRLIKRLIN